MLIDPTHGLRVVLNGVVKAGIEERVWLVFLLTPPETLPHHTDEVGTTAADLTNNIVSSYLRAALFMC